MLKVFGALPERTRSVIDSYSGALASGAAGVAGVASAVSLLVWLFA